MTYTNVVHASSVWYTFIITYTYILYVNTDLLFLFSSTYTDTQTLGYG